MFPVINLKETGINMPTIDNLFASSHGMAVAIVLDSHRSNMQF